MQLRKESLFNKPSWENWTDTCKNEEREGKEWERVGGKGEGKEDKAYHYLTLYIKWTQNEFKVWSEAR